MFEASLFVKFLIALVALLNPLYGIGPFLHLTADFSPEKRRQTALLASLAVAVIGITTGLIGEGILQFFGINVPSLRIAGGILIFGIALTMFNTESQAVPQAAGPGQAAKSIKDIAIVPIAMPLLVGPGVIATIIVFTHDLSGIKCIVTISSAILCLTFLIWLGLRFAAPLSGLLGNSGITIITRLMAVILAAVGVEMVLVGIDSHYPGLGS